MQTYAASLPSGSTCSSGPCCIPATTSWRGTITGRGTTESSQYVVDTSEFRDVRDRLAMLERRGGNEAKDDNRPTLRRRTSDKIEQDGGTQEDDGRPTLKRAGNRGASIHRTD